MSFAKQFIEAAAEDVEMAAEQLADRIKSERMEHDLQTIQIPSIKQVFQDVMDEELANVASVEFIEKQLLVNTKHEGTTQTHEAINRAYEKLNAEELISMPMNIMDGEYEHSQTEIEKKLKLKQSLHVPALTWR